MTIKIFLADDHVIIRQGIKALLEREPELDVIGETGDGLEVLGLVESIQPDVVVLDLEMPGMKGLEVTHQIRQNFRNTYVVILSMHDKEAYVLEALRKGASGYVLKGSEVQDLIQAIHYAVKGKRFLSQPLSDRAIEAYMQKAQGENLDPYETLTPRERQIFHLVIEGLSNKEIADRLVVSTRTVETHRSKMMRKLDLNNHIELIRYAIKNGIIPWEE
jgi:two-component system response regulator NreC